MSDSKDEAKWEPTFTTDELALGAKLSAANERAKLSTEDLIADNERRLAEVYADKGINLGISASLLRQVRAIKDAVNLGTADQEELEAVRHKNPQGVADAEVIITMEIKDEQFSDIMEQREAVQQSMREFQIADRKMEEAKTSYREMVAAIAEAEAETAGIMLKLPKDFQASEFEVRADVLRYVQADQEGRQPAERGYSPADKMKAKVYLARRASDPAFDAAAVIFEKFQASQYELNRCKHLLEVRIQKREEAKKNLEQCGERVEKAAMRLSQAIDLVK